MSALPMGAGAAAAPALPPKPPVLKAGIFLAWANIAIVLVLQIVDVMQPTGLLNLYGGLAILALQLIFLAGVANGGSKMRWVYIGFDVLQFALWVTEVVNTGKMETRDAAVWALCLAVWICFCMPASNAWYGQARALRLRWREQAPAEYAAFHKARALRLLASTAIGATSYMQLARPLHMPIGIVLVAGVPLLITGLWVAAWHGWQARGAGKVRP